jgi:uncharacterized protein
MTTFSGAQVATLWRYPVKSMQGEELNAAEVTMAGLLGDRRFAVVDPATGKVAGAKNPRRWPGFFYFRSAYVAPPVGGADLPAVRITMPDGACATSADAELPTLLSAALGREVALSAGLGTARAEGLEEATDEVVTWEMPPGTFFDSAPLHLVTTATLDKLRALCPAGRFEPRRFRPNIIITTPPDDDHRALRDDYPASGRPAARPWHPAHRGPAQRCPSRRLRRGRGGRAGHARGCGYRPGPPLTDQVF